MNKIYYFKEKYWKCIMLFFTLLSLCYLNSFKTKLTLDSKIIISGDTRLHDINLQNLKLIFTQNYWWPFTIADIYRPITTLSYLFNYCVIGSAQNTFSYHLINFSAHWLNTFLVFYIISKLSNNKLALLSACIFGVHPVCVESVTNIVGRGDLFATTSILLTTIIHMNFRRNSELKYAKLLLIFLITLIGVFAKESAVMVLVPIFLYDYIFIYKKSEIIDNKLKSRILFYCSADIYTVYIPVILSITILFIVRHKLGTAITVSGQYFVDNPISGGNQFAGLMTAIGVIGRYVTMLLFPISLSCDYSFNQIPLYGSTSLWWQDMYCWLSFIFIVYSIYFASRCITKHPIITYCTFFFYLILLPTSNILFPIGSIMAERFLYTALIPFSFFLGYIIIWLSENVIIRNLTDIKIISNYFNILIISILFMYGFRTVLRNDDWNDDLSLWKSAFEASPNSFKVYKGYGGTLYDVKHDEKSLDQAIALCEMGLNKLDSIYGQIDNETPTIYDALSSYYLIKGDFFMSRKSTIEATRTFKIALNYAEKSMSISIHVKKQRSILLAKKYNNIKDDSAPLSIDNYATLLLRLQMWKELILVSDQLMYYKPSESNGYKLKAVAQANLGNVNNSLENFTAALLLHPGDDEVNRNIKNLFNLLKYKDNAMKIVGTSTEFNTNIIEVRNLINKSFILIYDNLLARNAIDIANNVKNNAIKNYLVPKELFDTKI